MATTGLQISALPVAQALSGAELVPVVSVGHIAGITQAVTAVITISDTTTSNPFNVGQQFSIASVGGMTQINGLGGPGTLISAVGGVSGAWTITVPIDSSGFSAYTSGGHITATAQTTIQGMRLSATISPYNPTFASGGIQYAGPGGVITSSNNFIVGTAIPNPSGTPGPCLLLGSGGGSGANVSFWIIQDQAFDTSSPGNDLGITPGEVQPDSTERGGNLWGIGGAADLGTVGGGSNTQQGGTGARSPGGPMITQGGGNTDGGHLPGDNFQIAGETGSQGANTHDIMTMVNGVAGFSRERVNSTNIRDRFSDGSIYHYGSNGFGSPLAPWISRAEGAASGWAGSSEVYTGNIPPGSIIHVVNGLIVGYS